MRPKQIKPISFLLAALATAAYCCQAASAQACNPIATAPIVISTPGAYCVTQNLRYEGQDVAVTIATSNVTLDFGGYTLIGGASANAAPFSRGIFSVYNENITIRNGGIRNFGYGIQTTQQTNSPTKGILIERMLIDGVHTMGMSIQGRDAIIRDNRIASLTSTNPNDIAMGILVIGSGARIINNSIANVTSPYIPYGIFVSASGSIVQNNIVSDMGVSANGLNGSGIYVPNDVNGTFIEGNRLIQSSTASSIGINFSSPVTNAVVDNNVIIGYKYGTYLGNNPGIKYKNNTVIGASFTYTGGGSNLGGNQ